MKGEKFMKIIVVALLCVVACYLIFSVARFSGDSFTTYKAVRFEVGDGITTSGFLVRSEEPILADTGDIVVLTRAEGERVGKNQPVAATYKNEAARLRQLKIDELTKELAQMRYAYSFSGTDQESATLDNDILRVANQVTVAAARREYSAADEAAEKLKPYVLRRYLTGKDSQVLWARITAAQEQLEVLQQEAGTESGSVLAPVSGYFSGEADGYETELTPALLDTVSVETLDSYRGISRRASNAVGKLVTSQKWYFAAVVPSRNVADLEEGTRIDVNFSYDFYQTVRMKIERISSPEDGRCVLVLSSESYIQDAVTARTQTADLVFRELSGLRVPKTAIYVSETGESGVYVLEGAEAKWKAIKILYDNGDSFIVELDKSSTKNLWPEDEIILTTGELYSGKVMIK